MTPFFNRRALLGASGAVLASHFVQVPRARAQDAVAPSTPMPPLEAYALPAVVSEIALSPDGKRVAAVIRSGDGDGDNKVLIVFDVGVDKPTRINLGKDKTRDLFWGDNKHVLLIDSITMSLPEFGAQKTEVSMAHNIDAATGEVKTLFTNQPDTDTSTGSIMGRPGKFYPIVSPPLERIKVEGEYRVTAANYRMADSYDLCLFSFGMNSTVGKLMTRGAGDTEGFVVSPDGLVVAKSGFVELTREWTLSFNNALSEGKQRFSVVYRTKGDALSNPSLVGLGRDGTSVVIQEGADDGYSAQYYEISTGGTLSAPLDADGAGQARFPLFHPTTKRLAGFGRRGDTLIYDYFDPLMKSITAALPKVLGDGYRFYPASYAEDPRKLIVYSEGNGDAGSYYFVDLTTGNGAQLSVNYPDLPEEWVTQKQKIHYKAADGLEIEAYLTLPPFKTAQNLPLIVLPHGGPQAHDNIDFDWQTQLLASRGYAVLQPNFRGSSGYGSKFVAAGYGEWGRKMQTDLSDGVRYLAAKGTINPKRVAILGASYGGYAAMAGATLDPGVYNCAVAIAGVSDLPEMVEWEDNKTGNQESSTVMYWKRFMGDKAGWAAVSPARQAAKASCPVMLIHGTDDTVVPISQSQRMESALKAAGKPVEFITFPGQDHWETMGAARVAMMKAAMAFLAKYNPA